MDKVQTKASVPPLDQKQIRQLTEGYNTAVVGSAAQSNRSLNQPLNYRKPPPAKLGTDSRPAGAYGRTMKFYESSNESPAVKRNPLL